MRLAAVINEMEESLKDSDEAGPTRQDAATFGLDAEVRHVTLSCQFIERGTSGPRPPSDPED
jgi:hypothetical protein